MVANRKQSPQKGSQSVKWSSTRHTGVRYWESEARKHRAHPDKCYVIRYKNQGRSFSETIGWQSEGITPEYCSDLRGQITSNIKKGEGFHSLQEKRNLDAAKRTAEKSKAVTLIQAFEDFKSTRTLKATTLREYDRSINTAFTDWQSRRVIDISRDAVSKRHQKLKDDAQKNLIKKLKAKGLTPTKGEKEKRGSAQANLHMRFLRALLNFAAGFYEDADGGPLIKHNPVQRLSQTKQWYRVPTRQTIIKTAQLPAWFKAVQSLENEIIRDYLIFLLFTGSRREEGFLLEVEQVDLKNQTYTLIDPKNRQDITLPLPDFLFNVLAQRIKKLNGFKYVFPGMDRRGNLNQQTHLVEPKVQVQKVIQASKVSFTLHDLRRHYIALSDSLDLSSFCIKRLVNHSRGSDVTSGYVVSDVERLRGPMQKIEDKILQFAKVTKPGKVFSY
ncbi:MAG TPA: integrase [Nitrospina sp.]|jgi:integrase|nr:integrase [Nitrospina sp.]|tara:strand:- start:113 stop:1441 length:1329 start_codon:yes stop_codon:yes gene_type:complete